MKIAIIYASSHGTTQKVAELIAEKINEKDVVCLEAKKSINADLTTFDKIIIGGSIHAGQMQKSIVKFCEANSEKLLQSPLALFVCGMETDPEKKQAEVEKAYPEKLRSHASIVKFTGGEFLFEKMNFMERLIIKKIAKTDKSVSAIDLSAIEAFSAF